MPQKNNTILHAIQYLVYAIQSIAPGRRKNDCLSNYSITRYYYYCSWCRNAERLSNSIAGSVRWRVGDSLFGEFVSRSGARCSRLHTNRLSLEGRIDDYNTNNRTICGSSGISRGCSMYYTPGQRQSSEQSIHDLYRDGCSVWWRAVNS